ncbi:unnamed protein product, partial [marine sediment metagenome]
MGRRQREKAEITGVKITAIDFNNLQPKDVFEWLELFGTRRYGIRYYLDPSKRDDPRYPAELDESPVGWYTKLSITDNCYDKTMFIIDEETYEKIKRLFEEKMVVQPSTAASGNANRGKED